jgi:hypothetical protein
VTFTWVYNEEIDAWTLADDAEVIGSRIWSDVLIGLEDIFGGPTDETTVGGFAGNEVNIVGLPIVRAAELDFAFITPELRTILKTYARRLGVVGAGLSFAAAYNSYLNNGGNWDFATLENVGLGILSVVGIFTGGWIAAAIALVALLWGLASSAGLTKALYYQVFGMNP